MSENELAALVAYKEISEKRCSDSESGIAAALGLSTRPSDIIISTTAKAGTTWMQQICHQLRSGGDMSFPEISDVVPYLEVAADLGLDLDADGAFEPRVFKTHFWEPLTPKGARYIVVVRHPHDVAVSLYKFFNGWRFAEGAISADAFVREVWLRRGAPASARDDASAFHHYASWWPRRGDGDVLWVFYEDMKEDLAGEVKRVADFLGVADADTIRLATERASFDFMKRHEGQFDENHFKRKHNVGMGLSAGAGSGVSKVRVGGGQRHLLGEKTKRAIDRRWSEVCAPALGARDYDEWRRQVRAARS